MFNFVILSMKKHISSFKLIIVQFILGITALMIGLSLLFSVINLKKDVELLTSQENVQIYIDNLKQDKETIEMVKRVLNEMKNENIIKEISAFEEISYLPFELEDETVKDIDHIKIESNKNSTSYYGNPDIKNDYRDTVTLHIANQESLKNMNFKLEKGDANQLLDYNVSNEIIPVIISNDLKELNALNSIREIYYTKSDNTVVVYKIKVVGVLSPDMPIFSSGNSNIISNINTYENLIIVPQFDDFIDSTAYSCNTIIKINNEQDIDIIKERFIENGYSVDLKTIKSELDNYYKENKIPILFTISFSMIILILSIFGLIGVTLSLLENRKKEFGVYYLLGISHSKLVSLVLCELGIIFGASFIVSILSSFIILNVLINENGIGMSYSCSGVALIITILFLALSILIPMNKLKKFNPISLINGREE